MLLERIVDTANVFTLGTMYSVEVGGLRLRIYTGSVRYLFIIFSDILVLAEFKFTAYFLVNGRLLLVNATC